jgi:hypothetical protein
MPSERLVLCGGAGRPGRGAQINLNLHGTSRNVALEISDISKRLLANIPAALIDLLEIASYVYAADSAIPRGGKTDAQMGARWRRNLRFVIPVRLPDLWSSDPVSAALVETLSFLSEDDYKFEFSPSQGLPITTNYFEFSDSEGAEFRPDEVILFSGGLDSFAGAVERIVADRKKVALVSHRSSTKIVGAQKYLVDQLRLSRREGGDIYPAPSSVPAQGRAALDPEIRIGIDPKQKRVFFDRWGAIVGVSAGLIIALSEPFRQATRDELSPEHYRFTDSANLVRQTHCESNETLRRRILRCRNAISRLAEKAGDLPPPLDAVIENVQWHGYRLNPDRVRIVSISELSGDG